MRDTKDCLGAILAVILGLLLAEWACGAEKKTTTIVQQSNSPSSPNIACGDSTTVIVNGKPVKTDPLPCPKVADKIIQKSTGDCSPNIVGGNNSVTITCGHK